MKTVVIAVATTRLFGEMWQRVGQAISETI